MLMALTSSFILDQLREIADPALSGDIVLNQRVSSIIIKEGKVGFSLEFPEVLKLQAEEVRKSCITLLEALPEVRAVTIVLTAPTVSPKRYALPSVKKVIGIAAGKGGVGKSTV